MLHYFARDFFSAVLPVGFEDGDSLFIYAVSDLSHDTTLRAVVRRVAFTPQTRCREGKGERFPRRAVTGGSSLSGDRVLVGRLGSRVHAQVRPTPRPGRQRRPRLPAARRRLAGRMRTLHPPFLPAHLSSGGRWRPAGSHKPSLPVLA